MADQDHLREFVFGEDTLDLGALEAISRRAMPVRLSRDQGVIEQISRSARHVQDMLDRDGKIYGVTTGYGDSVDRPIPPDLVAELPLQLTRFHGCGLGRFLTPEETRAVMTVRLVTLVFGWSGVSLELVERLADMLRLDILPLIPAEGSVGASGDLTPLSYIAGALVGERRVLHRGKEKDASEAFAAEAITPLTLKPKEALALMNGTSVMSALTATALSQARRLADAAARMTSLTCLALMGNPRHFDERLFHAKPHPGQMHVAGQIRADLEPFARLHEASRMQDRYSVRCAPHVIGVLADAMPSLESTLTTEINSANDNPLFDPDTGDVLHGGHFYGGHACFVADTLKVQVANLADLMDRQLALLVDTRFNNGLPSNLSGAAPERAAVNHGFKAIQIAVSAWTAEACKLTMPASVFSRSTECHNQDKVSMGTIASRDALRVNQLVSQVAAAHLMATAQAVEIRLKRGELTEAEIGPALRSQIDKLRSQTGFLEEDTPLDTTLAALSEQILNGAMSFVWG